MGRSYWHPQPELWRDVYPGNVSPCPNVWTPVENGNLLEKSVKIFPVGVKKEKNDLVQ